jgi:hypothetical protein
VQTEGPQQVVRRLQRGGVHTVRVAVQLEGPGSTYNSKESTFAHRLLNVRSTFA